MDPNQYNLCLEVLKRFEKQKLLKDIMLVGSWCVPFYKEYFKGVEHYTSIRTTDIDFFVPDPAKIDADVSLPDLLKDLGFIQDFIGSKGYIRLMHPDLIIEFLVLEKGRGSDRPQKLKGLGVNATALRMLNVLSAKTIKVKIEDITLTLPHPANFALHKLLIASRRFKKKGKGDKDRETAFHLLNTLLEKGDHSILRSCYQSLSKRQQSTIRKELEESDHKEVLGVL